ncbi:hypothetical protein MPSEU_000051900 [Mayamaea pseudoterrestris]|nr:hypothetical protein MPSEU_000051900 [Mayamaea pseudoterrestris]
MSETIDQAERTRRRHRRDAFHLAASHTKMPDDPTDLEYDYTFNYLTTGPPRRSTLTNYGTRALLYKIKSDFVRELAMTGGDVQSPRFMELLGQMRHLYDPTSFDARVRAHSDNEKKLEGMWLTLSKPNYPGNLGRYNGSGGYLYSFGHMAMNMVPSDLICCIDGTFNPVHYVHTKDRLSLMDSGGVPDKLKALVSAKKCILRSSDIVSAVTIIPGLSLPQGCVSLVHSPNRLVLRPMRALLSIRGYLVAHPEQKNRLLAWFSHGSFEVSDDDRDQQTWRHILERTMSSVLYPERQQQRQSPQQQLRLEADGKLSFQMPPDYNEELMYVDVLYLDETIRVLQGGRGTIYVMARVPYFPDE